MGRRDRERIARIQAGEEKSISEQLRGLSNPIARKAVSFTSRGAVVDTLRRASTADQINILNSTVASSKLRRTLMSKAPREMDKGIKELQKQGKDVSVDALCEEIKNTPEFLSMCENAGLSLEWFENLAKERMEAHGL